VIPVLDEHYSGVLTRISVLHICLLLSSIAVY
jgi:hypothetical protein